MKESRKLYVKALKCYNNGEINKALDLCEKSIIVDMNNAASINLKGLIYYEKGELDSAQKLWKMNCHVNNDIVAEKYLNDSQNDRERLSLYIAAANLIKEIKIYEAIDILLKCTESDFNCINVNNYLAFCYIKIGDYQRALEKIDYVLSLDNKNESAIVNRKTLEKYYHVKKKIEINRRLAGICCGAAVLIATAGIIYIKSDINKQDKSAVYAFKLKSGKETNQKNLQVSKEKAVVALENKIDDNKQEESSQKQHQSRVLSMDELKKHIDNGEIDALYEDISNMKGKELKDEEKLMVARASSIMKDKGVKEYYSKGYEFVTKADYSNAIGYFKRAYEYGQDSYLYQHIIYFMAVSCEKTSDISSALNYYNQYDSLFSKGEYESTVLYNMALIYKDIDISKAKVYASKLMERYPESIYNNSLIKEIENKN